MAALITTKGPNAGQRYPLDGAGTLIGTEAVARAAPDGNTLLIVANSFVINPSLKKLNYDPFTSFAPICHLVSTPMIFAVNSDSPYRSLADLINAARAKPGELTMASVGPATSLHIASERFRRTANVNMTYVPFSGTALAVNALLGGHVTAVFAEYPIVVEQVKGGVEDGDRAQLPPQGARHQSRLRRAGRCRNPTFSTCWKMRCGLAGWSSFAKPQGIGSCRWETQ